LNTKYDAFSRFKSIQCLFGIREYFELRLIFVNCKPLQKCTEYRYTDILENGLSHQLYGLILTLKCGKSASAFSILCFCV